MNYSLYLFDFDYTLANSERGIVTSYRHVLEKHGFTGISDYAICRTIGQTVIDSFAQLTGEADMATLNQYWLEFREKADEVMVDNTVLYPEAITVLKKLKSHGCKSGIVSTKYRYRIMGSLERYNIVSNVDIIIGGEDVTSPKPDPEGVLKAIEHLDMDKDKTLYIGDSIIDARTGKNAGVDFAAVLTGATREEEFLDFPSIAIMKNLAELR